MEDNPIIPCRHSERVRHRPGMSIGEMLPRSLWQTCEAKRAGGRASMQYTRAPMHHPQGDRPANQAMFQLLQAK